MKSLAVYKVFNSCIEQDLKSKGYKKHKSSMLGYSKKVGECYINIWVQCSRDGFNEYLGAKFILQFSMTEKAEIEFTGLDGGRIPKYLTHDELEEVREIQNNVTSRLKKPPQSYFSPNWRIDTINWFRKQFEPITSSFTTTSDIWFRYRTEEDVVIWSNYLKSPILRTLMMLENDLKTDTVVEKHS